MSFTSRYKVESEIKRAKKDLPHLKLDPSSLIKLRDIQVPRYLVLQRILSPNDR